VNVVSLWLKVELFSDFTACTGGASTWDEIWRLWAQQMLHRAAIAEVLVSLSWGYSVLHNYTSVTSTASAFPKIKGIYFKGRRRNTFWFRDCSAQHYKKDLIIKLMFSCMCKTYKTTSPQQQNIAPGWKPHVPSRSLPVKAAASPSHHFWTFFQLVNLFFSRKVQNFLGWIANSNSQIFSVSFTFFSFFLFLFFFFSFLLFPSAVTNKSVFRSLQGVQAASENSLILLWVEATLLTPAQPSDLVQLWSWLFLEGVYWVPTILWGMWEYLRAQQEQKCCGRANGEVVCWIPYETWRKGRGKAGLLLCFQCWNLRNGHAAKSDVKRSLRSGRGKRQNHGWKRQNHGWGQLRQKESVL